MSIKSGVAALAFAVFAQASILAQRPPGPTPHPSSDAYFDVLGTIGPLMLDTRREDGLAPPARWEKEMATDGFHRNDPGSDLWILRDVAGELHTEAVFSRDKVSFTLHYFPAGMKPLPDPLLSHLLIKADSTSFGSGDQIELSFPWRTPKAEAYGVTTCHGRERELMTIQLTGGRLLNQSRIIECQAK